MSDSDMTIKSQSEGREFARQLVEDTAALVSPPDICIRVAELIQSPETSAGEIGEVIIRDPSLTARLLRLVNSPFYSLRGEVDTVSRAIAVIGPQELYSLVLTVSAVKSFSNVPNSQVNMDTFWRHSVYTGLIARGFGKHCNVLHPERLFVAGLLHDIGCLVLYKKMQDASRDLLMSAGGDEEVFYQAEQQELGYTHADVGELLLETWSLPTTLCSAVRWHHEPCQVEEGRIEAAVLYVANILANRSMIGGYCEQTNCLTPIDPAALEIIGVRADDIDEEEVIGQAGIAFAETASVLAA